MGVMKVTKDFEGERFFDRSGWKYLAVCFAIILTSSILIALGREKAIPRTFVISDLLILLALLLIVLIYIKSKISKTITWGTDRE